MMPIPIPFGSLIVWFSFLLVVVVGCTVNSEKTPVVEKGILDLRNWDFKAQGNVKCDGEWLFYWKKLYTFEDFRQDTTIQPEGYITVPGFWTSLEVDQTPIEKRGYATYKSTVLIAENVQHLGVSLTPLGTAAKVYINESLIMTQGQVGTTEENSIPLYEPQTIVFYPDTTVLNIIVEISNFHYRNSGFWESLIIGDIINLNKADRQNYRLDMFLLGGLIIIGIYHIILYFIRQKEKKALYFGMGCFFIGFRIISVKNPIILDFFELPWAWIIRFEYIGFYAFISCFSLFVYETFPHANRKIIISAFVISTLYILLVILTPPLIFTYSIASFQVITLILIIYALYFISKSIRKNKSVWFFLVGFSTLVLTFINDSLYGNEIIQTTYLAPIGLYMFTLSQAVLLSFHFVSGFSRAEKFANLLDNTNKNLERLVEKRTKSLSDAKKQLEDKHHQIKSSISYAQHIQDVILPSLNKIKEEINDFFILFQPRNIVSGDFYWFTKVGNKIFIAVIDCTGHGVPGAFLSFLGYGLLNEIIQKNPNSKPLKILENLKTNFEETMSKNQKYGQDSMDIALCMIDKTKKVLEFAGLHRPLVYIQPDKDGNPKLHVSLRNTADAKDISTKDQTLYQHQVTLKNNSIFYMFSDGYSDQFGGKNCKRIGSKRFIDVLFKIHHHDMEKQKELLVKAFESWRCANPDAVEAQIDDILVLGFRINEQEG